MEPISPQKRWQWAGDRIWKCCATDQVKPKAIIDYLNGPRATWVLTINTHPTILRIGWAKVHSCCTTWNGIATLQVIILSKWKATYCLIAQLGLAVHCKKEIWLKRQSRRRVLQYQWLKLARPRQLKNGKKEEGQSKPAILENEPVIGECCHSLKRYSSTVPAHIVHAEWESSLIKYFASYV